MSVVFANILSMSINSIWLICAVWLLRLIFCNAPKSWRSVLWGLVGFRLICPFSIPSSLSLVPTIQTASTDLPTDSSSIINDTSSSSQTTLPTENSVLWLTEEATPKTLDIFYIITTIWILGICFMLLYAIISYLRLYRKTNESVLSEKRCYICDRIQSPFILGLFRPKILLPSTTTEKTFAYVREHECAHLKRFDHWRKFLGYIILSVHWFNPFVWLSYVLFCRDIELACDEKATKNYSPSEKAGYSEALLYFSTTQNPLIICPFSFGESGIKKRIKSVFNYKKPALWLIILTAIATAVVCICFMTKPNTEKQILDKAVSRAIIEYNYSPDEDCYPIETHTTYSTRKNGNLITVFLWVDYRSYSNNNPLGIVEMYSGSSYPCAITFEKDDEGNYLLLEYWEPEDGTYYATSIREKFPAVIAELAIWNVNVPKKPNMDEVYEHFNSTEKITFVSSDCGELFSDEEGDVMLTLDTTTETATLSVNSEIVFTEPYFLSDIDEKGNEVPIYISICDVDNLPDNYINYDFIIIDKETLSCSNFDTQPEFNRVDK